MRGERDKTTLSRWRDHAVELRDSPSRPAQSNGRTGRLIATPGRRESRKVAKRKFLNQVFLHISTKLARELALPLTDYDMIQ